jgi:hypothetical protein
MAETKDDIAAERDKLREENNRLKAQLAAAGGSVQPYAPQQTFQLSEGDRQELAARGIVNVGGRMRTADEVREMLPDSQRDVDLGSAPVPDYYRAGREQGTTPGVDFVYPSVGPGQIDPAVAGTPGISGPAADDESE